MAGAPATSAPSQRRDGNHEHARFRPHRLPLTPHGTWSWQENPFVGTRPYQGLLVLMMILTIVQLRYVERRVTYG